mmetsp:Transcript_8092/g.25866  ORF Transcript_8092/g.25866 Transcript_8092/m.25866 type:complete len:209 (-) Transcript_8092:2948-3574(-)
MSKSTDANIPSSSSCCIMSDASASGSRVASTNAWPVTTLRKRRRPRISVRTGSLADSSLSCHSASTSRCSSVRLVGRPRRKSAVTESVKVAALRERLRVRSVTVTDDATEKSRLYRTRALPYQTASSRLEMSSSRKAMPMMADTISRPVKAGTATAERTALSLVPMRATGRRAPRRDALASSVWMRSHVSRSMCSRNLASSSSKGRVV